MTEKQLEQWKAKIGASFHAPKGTAVRIKWGGKYVRVCSGKEAWATVSAAKNALHNHLYSCLGWTDYHKNLPTGYIDILVKDGILEFEVIK